MSRRDAPPERSRPAHRESYLGRRIEVNLIAWRPDLWSWDYTIHAEVFVCGQGTARGDSQLAIELAIRAARLRVDSMAAGGPENEPRPQRAEDAGVTRS